MPPLSDYDLMERDARWRAKLKAAGYVLEERPREVAPTDPAPPMPPDGDDSDPFAPYYGPARR